MANEKKTEPEPKEPSENALLTEYQTCQSEIDKRGNQFWVSLSIIIALNLSLLTQSAYDVITDSLSRNGLINVLAIFALGALMIAINYLFLEWQERQHYVTQVMYQRMRNIESVTGMQRGWLIHYVDLKNDHGKQDEWKNLPEAQRELVDRFIEGCPQDSSKNYKRPQGDKVFGHVLCGLIVLWSLLIFLVILTGLIPVFKAWLIN